MIPHLRILSTFPWIEEIYFLTIERGQTEKRTLSIDKVIYQPLYSLGLPIGIVNKISDFALFPRQIAALVREKKVDHLICRTALGGALGYLVHKKVGASFIVESFEPHADYMLEAGVWSRSGLKYRFQKYWEDKVIANASHIVTVSKHFTALLKSVYDVDCYTFGCAVDTDQFRFDPEKRQTIRDRLGWDTRLVGIYVGKFGDIYYDQKAFDIFRKAFDFFGSAFRLIILSPNPKNTITARMQAVGIPIDNCLIDLVPHHEVPGYLSASDFAFSMVRPAPVRLYCSPIKDGEYWANGLPILSGDQIGEDSDIIKEEQAGAIFKDDLSDLQAALEEIKVLAVKKDRLGSIRDVAMKYRSFQQLPRLYQALLS